MIGYGDAVGRNLQYSSTFGIDLKLSTTIGEEFDKLLSFLFSKFFWGSNCNTMNEMYLGAAFMRSVRDSAEGIGIIAMSEVKITPDHLFFVVASHGVFEFLSSQYVVNMVDGMNKPCRGSRDKSLPRNVFWKIVPHKLFFAHSHTHTWGKGGAAFLHPESNTNDKAYLCIYRITLEQFNDVLFQENTTSELMESPLLDETQLMLLAEKKTMLLEVLKGGRYSNVLYLGKEDGLPILTMTCPISDIEQFKSGELPMCAPSESYRNTLVEGLVEGKQLPRQEAIDYLKNAADRKL